MYQENLELPVHKETEGRVDSRVFLDPQADLDNLDQLVLKDHLEVLEHRSDSDHTFMPAHAITMADF